MKKIKLFLMLTALLSVLYTNSTTAQLCLDSTALNYEKEGECVYENDTLHTVCSDTAAINFGSEGECEYETGLTCWDPSASNHLQN
ncbi:hypothetical protein OAO55_00900, partial [Bacteroidales bacterium]|nr:hypothetical protein [Bacteroidales bacterium]